MSCLLERNGFLSPGSLRYEVLNALYERAFELYMTRFALLRCSAVQCSVKHVPPKRFLPSPKLPSSLLLPVQIGIEIPPEIRRRIVEPQLLINRIQLLQILLIQFKVTSQITSYALRRLTLRQHAMALCNPPRQRDLRAVLAVFLAHGNDGGVLDEFAHVLPGAVDGVLVAEGGVLLDVDVFGLVVGGEGGLLEPGVELDLVRGGDDGGFGEEAGEFRVAEVGDADGFGFAAAEGFFHGFP